MVYFSYYFFAIHCGKGGKSGNKEAQLEVKDFQIENNGCNQKSVIHLSVALQVFFVSTTTSESQITKMPACQKRTCPFEHLADHLKIYIYIFLVMSVHRGSFWY